MSENDISKKQIDDMLHAIGYKKSSWRKDTHLAYRNHFCANSIDPDWEGLVLKKFATRSDINTVMLPVGAKVYHVTRAGMDYLEGITGVKIVEDD